MSYPAQKRISKNSNAVITGATQGIGKSVAEKLLSEGFNIAICARSIDDLNELRATWTKQYPAAQVITIAADFSEKKNVLAFAEEIITQFNEINILINNAGIYQPDDLATEPDGQLEHLINVNLYGAYYLTRAMLPYMNEGSHIFNICSVASLKAYLHSGAYSITKYALLGFSDNLREELKPRGIKVTAICPGATWSSSWSRSNIPVERIMKADDIAAMLWASYMLSAQANVETIVMRPVAGDL